MNLEIVGDYPAKSTNIVHDWLDRLHVAVVPGPSTFLTDKVSAGLLDKFAANNHYIQETPDDETDLILTSARYDEPVKWRRSLLFNARRRFSLTKFPAICTLVHITPGDFSNALEQIARALTLPSSPANYPFAGLAANAHLTLHEQGKRGGPILSLERIVQSQTMCLRALLLVGDDAPDEAFLFDLVGAHPRILGSPESSFYEQIVHRLTTALSSGDVTNYSPVAPSLSMDDWNSLSAPAAMKEAGRELDDRGFFTEMVVIDNMVDVPSLNDAIAGQYSEGCYSTWDLELGALISTITGSARPVRKGEITDNELSIVVGVLADGSGVKTRIVDGLSNSPPSSEAFEMIDLDSALPRISLDSAYSSGKSNGHPNTAALVPVVRSKLHGHRGVSAFNPGEVAFAPLQPAYYHFPVSCGSASQARAIKSAFARCDALTNPADPRQIAFTILPGHGLFIAEKWDQTKKPFQLIWEAMDSGALKIDSHVPQGVVSYIQKSNELFKLRSEKTLLASD